MYGTKQLDSYKLFRHRARCWACGHTPGVGISYSSRYHGLHRCHVQAVAALGSDHPSNIVIMCRACHLDNPDSDDVDLFWTWFSSVIHDKRERLMRAARHKVTTGQTDTAGLIVAYLNYALQDEPILVGNALPLGYTVAVLRRLARKFQVRGKKMTAPQERHMAKSLMWAHRLLEGMLQWRSLRFNLLGLKHAQYIKLRDTSIQALAHFCQTLCSGDEVVSAWVAWILREMPEAADSNKEVLEEFMWRAHFYLNRCIEALHPDFFHDSKVCDYVRCDIGDDIRLAKNMYWAFWEAADYFEYEMPGKYKTDLVDLVGCAERRWELIRFALARLVTRDEEKVPYWTVVGGSWSAPVLGFERTPELSENEMMFLVKVGAVKRLVG